MRKPAGKRLPHGSTLALVLDALVRLHGNVNFRLGVPRSALVREVPLPETTIDDRLRVLVNQEKVKSAGRGLYLPSRPKRHPVGVTQALVLEAVKTLHEQGRDCSRAALMEATGLNMTTIDDRLKRLTNLESIVRIARGQYAPASHFPASRSIKISVKTEDSQAIWTIQIGSEGLRMEVRASDRDALLRQVLPDGSIEYVLRDQRLVVTQREDALIWFPFPVTKLQSFTIDWPRE